MALLNAKGKELKIRWPEEPLVVIYCHPKRAGGVPFFLDHWDKDAILAMITAKIGRTKKVNIYTLDPFVYDWGQSANIVMDGFSNEFIGSHQSAFDMLVLPDCGGPWGKAAMAGETNTLIEIIERFLTMIKPGGYLCLQKFMDVATNDIKTHFQKNGVNVEEFPSFAPDGPYLVLTRPAGKTGGRRRKTARRRVKRSKTNRKHRG